jgi:MFS family permease
MRARALQTTLLVVAVASATYAGNTLSPLQETLRAALSLSDNQMALLQGPALAFPMAAVWVPLGMAIDRYSRMRLLAVIMVSALLGSVLTAMASGLPMLVIARGFAGLASLAVIPVAFSWVADLYAPQERGRATMAINIGQSIGMAAAFALGSTLLAAFAGSSDTWRRVMLWLAAPLAPATLLLLPLREAQRTEIASQRASSSREWIELWRHRAILLPLLLGIVLGQVALWADFMWSAPMLSRSFSLTPREVGTVMAVGLFTSGVVGSIGGGFIADFCQSRGGARLALTALSGLVLLSATVGLFAFIPNPIGASVMLVTFVTIANATAVMATALFIIVTPNGVRGLCMALLVTICVFVGNGLGPVIASVLSMTLGGEMSIGKSLSVICAVTSTAAAGMFALGVGQVPRGHAKG